MCRREVRGVNSTIAWDLVEGEYTPRSPTEAATRALRRATHCTIKKVLPEIKLIPSTPAVVDLQEFIRLTGQVRVAGDVERSATVRTLCCFGIPC